MVSMGDIGLEAYEKGLVKQNELIFGTAIFFAYLNKRVNCVSSNFYVIKYIERM